MIISTLSCKLQKWTCDCIEDKEFTCGDGICIIIEAVCDGSLDCSDRSDEENCLNHTCSTGWTKCADYITCRAESVFCDRVGNCPGYTDESDCDCVRTQSFITKYSNMYQKWTRNCTIVE